MGLKQYKVPGGIMIINHQWRAGQTFKVLKEIVTTLPGKTTKFVFRPGDTVLYHGCTKDSTYRGWLLRSISLLNDPDFKVWIETYKLEYALEF